MRYLQTPLPTRCSCWLLLAGAGERERDKVPAHSLAGDQRSHLVEISRSHSGQRHVTAWGALSFTFAPVCFSLERATGCLSSIPP